MIRKLCCVIGLFLGLATPAWAAPAIVHQDSWTCASGTTCNHTLAFTPVTGDIFVLFSTSIDTYGNSDYWYPANDGVSCAAGSIGNYSGGQVSSAATYYTYHFQVKLVGASPSTTCNTTAYPNSDTMVGSVNVLDISGLLSTSAVLDHGSDFPSSWANSTSSASSGTVTPTNANEFAICVQAASFAVPAQTFSGGALTWTPYLDNSSLGSTDLAAGGQYPSTTPFACTSTYTSTAFTVMDILMFVPAAAPSGVKGIYPWPQLFMPALYHGDPIFEMLAKEV